MKTNNTNKFYDRKTILIGLVLGLIGGGLMIGSTSTNLGLGNFYGYLFLIIYIFIITAGLIIYKIIEKENSSFFKRLGFAFFIYSVISIVQTFYQISSNTYGGQNNTFTENLLVILITSAIGLFLSSLLALCIKTRE